MNAKEFFSLSIPLNKRINSKLDHLLALRDLVSKATATISDMPSRESRDVHQLEDVICRIVDLERDVNADIDHLLDLKEEYMSIISEIEKPMLQVVLEQRYLCCHSWSHISTELDYELRSLYRLHSEAIKAADELMQKRICDSTQIVTK